jgi:hypothetical protein
MRPHAHLGEPAEQVALLRDAVDQLRLAVVEQATRFRRAYIRLWTTLTLAFFLLLVALRVMA